MAYSYPLSSIIDCTLWLFISSNLRLKCERWGEIFLSVLHKLQDNCITRIIVSVDEG